MLNTNRAQEIRRIGARKLHAAHDSLHITQAARNVFLQRSERDADPYDVLLLKERQHRAKHLLRTRIAQPSLLDVAIRQCGRAIQRTPMKEAL